MIANHTNSLARVKKIFQTSASIYSLFFSDSLCAHWLTLTSQLNPKSKHLSFSIFFPQRRAWVFIIQAITDSISRTSYLFFSHIINNWNFLLTRKVLVYIFRRNRVNKLNRTSGYFLYLVGASELWWQAENWTYSYLNHKLN